MNERYFACTDCQIYVNAGYRWCYWELEHPGIVRLGDTVDIAAVLAHEPYWNPGRDEDAMWLYDEVFPSVRDLFEKHKGHHVVYWEDNHLPNDVFRNWLQLGHFPYPSPRYCVEVLKMTRWEDVVHWREAAGWSWGNRERQAEFRQAFEEHLQRFLK